MSIQEWVRAPYKQYFIGGPFHGKDKLSDPNTKHISPLQGSFMWRQPVSVTKFSACPEYLNPGTSSTIDGVYEFTRLIILGKKICIWMDSKETKETAQEKLMEILLAPHKRE
jgi:hypothetical protein